MLTLSQVTTKRKHIKKIFETQNMVSAQYYIGVLYPKEISLEEYNMFHAYLNSLNVNSDKMKLMKQYEKEYRATGEENIALENKLRKYNIGTEFSVDHIFFTDWHTNEVIYSFEL